MTDVIHLTTGAFEKALAQDRPLLLDFWAPWCGPCRRQGPVLDDVARSLGTRALVAKINVDEEPQLAAQFAVQSIPTLVVVKDRKVVQRMVGLQSAEALIAALQEAGA